MSETSYYQRNYKDYYKNNKEVLREREQKLNIENYLKKKKI